MRGLIAVVAVALCPLQAVADDTAACDDTWEDIVTFAGALGEEIAEASVVNGDDGWCDVSATLDVSNIEASFRIDQFAQAPQNARSIEVMLQDLDGPVGVFDVTAALSYQPTSRAFRLHQLTARADDGRGLLARANMVLDGFVSGTDFQAALSGVTAQDASVAFFVTPGLLQDADIDLTDLTRVAVNDALSKVSEQQVSRRARSEFLRFVGAVPNARGTLAMTVDMPGGRSVLQIAGLFAGLSGNTDLSDVIAAALMDTTLDLTWKPGRM